MYMNHDLLKCDFLYTLILAYLWRAAPGVLVFRSKPHPVIFSSSSSCSQDFLGLPQFSVGPAFFFHSPHVPIARKLFPGNVLGNKVLHFGSPKEFSIPNHQCSGRPRTSSPDVHFLQVPAPYRRIPWSIKVKQHFNKNNEIRGGRQRKYA